MVTTLERPRGVTPGALMSRQNLIRTAARYIYRGASAVTLGDLESARNEVRRLMDWAEVRGLSQRDVVVGIMRPVLSLKEHCRCLSCRQHCVVCCYADGLETPSQF